MSGTSRSCEAEGCLRVTREGKPYCLDHVLLNGYVSRMMGEMFELNRSRNSGKDPTGILANEVLVVLEDRGGAASVERISKTMNAPDTVIRKVLSGLSKKGKVTLAVTNRGKTIAKRRCG